LVKNFEEEEEEGFRRGAAAVCMWLWQKKKKKKKKRLAIFAAISSKFPLAFLLFLALCRSSDLARHIQKSDASNQGDDSLQEVRC
jgi:hypothetical protein